MPKDINKLIKEQVEAVLGGEPAGGAPPPPPAAPARAAPPPKAAAAKPPANNRAGGAKSAGKAPPPRPLSAQEPTPAAGVHVVGVKGKGLVRWQRAGAAGHQQHLQLHLLGPHSSLNLASLHNVHPVATLT